jgi:hypothetical protein
MELLEFCSEIINGTGGLHAMEYYELAVPTIDRDEAVAAWVIQCLANPNCEGSDYVLEQIQARRAQILEEGY